MIKKEKFSLVNYPSYFFQMKRIIKSLFIKMHYNYFRNNGTIKKYPSILNSIINNDK